MSTPNYKLNGSLLNIEPHFSFWMGEGLVVETKTEMTEDSRTKKPANEKEDKSNKFVSIIWTWRVSLSLLTPFRWAHTEKPDSQRQRNGPVGENKNRLDPHSNFASSVFRNSLENLATICQLGWDRVRSCRIKPISERSAQGFTFTRSQSTEQSSNTIPLKSEQSIQE